MQAPSWQPFRAPEQASTTEVRNAEIALVREVATLTATDTVVFEDEGWDSRVYLVNDGEAVFKFPRAPEVQARYAQEIAILRALESYDLPVRLPRVRWLGRDHAYLGYEGIVGRTPDVERLPPDARRRIGRALGGFVRVLHGIDLSGTRRMSVEDEIADFRSKYDAAQQVVAEHFDRDERRRLDDFYEVVMPAELRRLGGDPRLCHGDLGPWNLIVGADDAVGVIDFGDVMVCDRSKDLIGIFDPVMLDAALDEYGDSVALREKIAVRADALPAMDLLFFAGKRDSARLAVCVDRIRQRLLA